MSPSRQEQTFDLMPRMAAQGRKRIGRFEDRIVESCRSLSVERSDLFRFGAPNDVGHSRVRKWLALAAATTAYFVEQAVNIG